jgi:hypothetical protein
VNVTLTWKKDTPTVPPAPGPAGPGDGAGS